MDHVNGLLAAEVARAGGGDEPSILDLGCGVGGSVVRLAESIPGARLLGVTISPRQVTIADRLAERRGVAHRCRFVLGDFLAADLGTGHEVALAVESFVHAPESADFFAAAARALRPGGTLVLVDDFLTRPRERIDAAGRGLVDAFVAGWRVPGLCTGEDAERAARAAGFALEEEADLTELLRLGRPRDRLIAWLGPMARRLRLTGVPFFGNLVGGNALQAGVRAGILGYRLLVFRRAWGYRSAEPGHPEAVPCR